MKAKTVFLCIIKTAQVFELKIPEIAEASVQSIRLRISISLEYRSFSESLS
jgi:hypothetical protein